MFERFIEDYCKNDLGGLCEYEKLDRHTTLRVGGRARIMATPDSKDNFIQTVVLARTLGLEYKILGKGSNILVSDDDFLGVVIKTDKCLDYFSTKDTSLTVGAGASTIKLARDVAKLGLSGLEFVSGIPGTVGGAVFMNAGAYNNEMKDVVVRVLILDECNSLKWISNAELCFSYRSSVFQNEPDWVVVEVELEMVQGDFEKISELMKLRKKRRAGSQPLEFPTAGSTFRNPDGYDAWKLIEDANLRGAKVGGARVSDKHCNFVVNYDGATATDIYELISYVKRVVFDVHGVKLHQEVEFFNWKMEQRK